MPGPSSGKTSSKPATHQVHTSFRVGHSGKNQPQAGTQGLIAPGNAGASRGPLQVSVTILATGAAGRRKRARRRTGRRQPILVIGCEDLRRRRQRQHDQCENMLISGTSLASSPRQRAHCPSRRLAKKTAHLFIAGSRTMTSTTVGRRYPGGSRLKAASTVSTRRAPERRSLTSTVPAATPRGPTMICSGKPIRSIVANLTPCNSSRSS